ncbi:MAG: hypothetical protein ACLFVJ_17715 [Persicimonas sp.]
MLCNSQSEDIAGCDDEYGGVAADYYEEFAIDTFDGPGDPPSETCAP